MNYLLLVVAGVFAFYLQTPIDEKIKNKTWLLCRIDDLKERKKILLKNRYTLSFTDSTMSGYACNSFWTQYTVTGNRIEFLGLAQTERGCHGEEELVLNYVNKYFWNNTYKVYQDSLYLIHDKKVIFTYYQEK